VSYNLIVSLHDIVINLGEISLCISGFNLLHGCFVECTLGPYPEMALRESINNLNSQDRQEGQIISMPGINNDLGKQKAVNISEIKYSSEPHIYTVLSHAFYTDLLYHRMNSLDQQSQQLKLGTLLDDGTRPFGDNP